MENPHEPQQPLGQDVHPAQPVDPGQPMASQQPTASTDQPQRMDTPTQPGAPAGVPGTTPASGLGTLAASPLTLWPLLAAVASVLLLIGGAGPWVSVLGIEEVGGSSGDGALVIVLALLALAAAVVMAVPALARLAWRRHLGWVITGLGLIAVLIGLYDTAHIHHVIEDNDAEGLMHLGWGLVMTDIFSIVLTALGVLTALTARSAHNAARAAAGETVVPIGQNPQVLAARGTLAGLASRAAQHLEPQSQPGSTAGAQQASTPQVPQDTPPAQQPRAPRQWTMPGQD